MGADATESILRLFRVTRISLMHNFVTPAASVKVIEIKGKLICLLLSLVYKLALGLLIKSCNPLW